ncbi:MAG TPA: HdeD family acid-resistance protein [Phycisphaerae bacterium]|nr:HdeD family acid-resistance protein [Phycisphaerae bacterium]HOJ76437.1 HdeD family acid-resistance protein [Phycisphaerae bacterium]HOM53883.1 HdeD family acid-resistance protein [Phycisphaerae bacterium]HOQ86249.1 HdeD family acid-resistance protein [Phycisphaerae bacterium]HPP29160.1 HdeD family acid-resistance protein [Phycisphaerae bacterium]
MLYAIARNWWMLLIRGIAAIVFGVLAFFWPGITLLVLVLLFAAYALVDGVTAIGLAAVGRTGERAWWEMMLVGILGVAAGIIAFVWPGLTAFVLLLVIAFWAIARGIFEIAAAIQLRKALTNEWLLILAGALSILFGVLLLFWPAAGALAVVWMIGIYAILLGVVSIALSLRLHHVKDRLEATTPTSPTTSA